MRLLLFESFGGFGKGVREILWKAADVLQNKMTRAQYLDGAGAAQDHRHPSQDHSTGGGAPQDQAPTAGSVRISRP